MARLDRVSPRLGRTLSNTSSGGGALQQQQHLRTLSSAGGSGGGGGSAGFSPGSAGAGSGASGGGVRGREVPASMALMRRPSWSSRSSAFNQLPGEASQPGVGYSGALPATGLCRAALAGQAARHTSHYLILMHAWCMCLHTPKQLPASSCSLTCSPHLLAAACLLAGCPAAAVSPMQDPALESLLAGSTPRQYTLAAGGLPYLLTAAQPGGQPQPGARGGGMGGLASGYGSGGALPLLTFPSGSAELGGGPLDEAGECAQCTLLWLLSLAPPCLCLLPTHTTSVPAFCLQMPCPLLWMRVAPPLLGCTAQWRPPLLPAHPWISCQSARQLAPQAPPQHQQQVQLP